jgi:hypothetical protein
VGIQLGFQKEWIPASVAMTTFETTPLKIADIRKIFETAPNGIYNLKFT